jgi:translocation and assembly module TamB
MRMALLLTRIVGGVLGVAIVIALAGFGLLQTAAGRVWLERTVAAAASTPARQVSIEGLRGIVPFRFAVARIALADRAGTYATLRDVSLDLGAAALFAGRLEIRGLRIGELDLARPSVIKSPEPLAADLRLPHLPAAVTLDRLAIGRLILGAPYLGERVAATLTGRAAIANGRAKVRLDLHRIDGRPGNLSLTIGLAGAAPTLTVRLAANEPSGLLLDRLLGRTDHLPLALALDGSGPLADWHGRLAVSAATLARIDAQLALAVGVRTTLGLSGTAALLPLLPAQFAPILGNRVTFSLHARKADDRLVLGRLAVAAAGGTVTGNASFASAAIAAKLRVDVPQLSRLSGLLGAAVHGSAALRAAVTGSEHRPIIAASLRGTRIGFDGYAAGQVTADLSATPTGDLDSPRSRIAVAAKGRIERIDMPARLALWPGRDRGIDWSLEASAIPDGSAVELNRLAANGAGLSLAATGRLAEGGRGVTGRARLSVADLRPFSDLAGRPIAGSVVLEGAAERRRAGEIEATFNGNVEAFQTATPSADAFLGTRIALTASLRRNAEGLLILDKLAVAGADAKFSADGRFDPRSHRLAAAALVEVPRLRPLGAALGGDFAGAVSARASFVGPPDRLRVIGRIEGRDIAAGRLRMDRLRLDVQIADLAHPEPIIDGRFRAAGLEGTVSLTAAMSGRSELSVPRLRLAAADGVIDGGLRIGLDSGVVRGSLTGRIPDLARWSRLAGTPLGGNLTFTARLAAQGGQALDLTMTGTGLAVGAGASRLAIGRLDLGMRLAGLYRAASGTGRLALTSVRFRNGGFAAARLQFASLRPDRFAFEGSAAGRRLSVAIAGDAEVAPAGATDQFRGLTGYELRLTRLTGLLGGEKFMLYEPLVLSGHGADIAFSGLALGVGAGRIVGHGRLRGQALSLNLNGARLPVAAAANLLGHPDVQGALTFSATIGGTVAAPHGRVEVQLRKLSFAAPVGAQVPRLGLAVTGDWNGRNLALDGRVTGLAGDRIAFAGAVPLLLRTNPYGISVLPDGRLALRLQGEGEIGRVADLLPIGEDRLSGRFAANLALDGTVVAPSASGRITLSDGRYANFASGAILTRINATLTGNRDRLSLTSFSAGDGASGTMTAKGSIIVNGAAGPTAELSATLDDFRVAARDEALVTASGRVSIAGPLAKPTLKAPLTIDRADLNLPASLPPSVVVIRVVRTGTTTGKRPAPAAPPSAVLPADLDIVLSLPGKIFVRGHGLDSEWRGRLRITGTSSTPRIVGALHAIHGTFEILGKSFRVTRGLITFTGGAQIDPVLDISAQVVASDIVAQITIGGLASAPKITLSSTPALPQDEILSRILFNQSTSRITAAQGLALAQAAATLTGGGPGVIDRLRSNLGLDWLRLGQAGAGPANGIVNPNPNNPSATNGTAITAGKYIANGVSIGVTQGVSPPTSQVTVEVQLGHHLTVDTSAGQNGGTGVGLSYNYDY